MALTFHQSHMLYIELKCQSLFWLPHIGKCLNHFCWKIINVPKNLNLSRSVQPCLSIWGMSIHRRVLWIYWCVLYWLLFLIFVPCILHVYLALNVCKGLLQTSFLDDLTSPTRKSPLSFFSAKKKTEIAAWYIGSPTLDYYLIKFHLENDIPVLQFHMLSIPSHSLNILNQHEDNWKLTMVIFQWAAYGNWIVFPAKKWINRQGIRKNCLSCEAG